MEIRQTWKSQQYLQIQSHRQMWHRNHNILCAARFHIADPERNDHTATEYGAHCKETEKTISFKFF